MYQSIPSLTIPPSPRQKPGELFRMGGFPTPGHKDKTPPLGQIFSGSQQEPQHMRQKLRKTVLKC